MSKGIAKAYIKKLVLNHNLTQSQKQTQLKDTQDEEITTIESLS